MLSLADLVLACLWIIGGYLWLRRVDKRIWCLVVSLMTVVSQDFNWTSVVCCIQHSISLHVTCPPSDCTVCDNQSDTDLRHHGTSCTQEGLARLLQRFIASCKISIAIISDMINLIPCCSLLFRGVIPVKICHWRRPGSILSQWESMLLPGKSRPQLNLDYSTHAS